MRSIALLFLCPVLSIASEPLRIPWQLAPAACAGKKALVTLTDGTRLEGSLLSVSPSAFEMEVERTSDRRKVANGFQRLDRAQFAGLRIREKRIRGRVIGTVAGVMLAGPAVFAMNEQTVGVWGLPVYAGIITAGHLLGRVFDRQSRLVLIEPDLPATVGE